VTPASVYNILLCFAGLGIYGRRPSTDSKMYFDANPTSHIHLYDTQNQVFMEPGDDGTLEEVLRKLEGRRFKGYRIEGVDLQILCRPRTRRRTLK
jgi:Fe2+ or Zn2+ uptake regulation protein